MLRRHRNLQWNRLRQAHMDTDTSLDLLYHPMDQGEVAEVEVEIGQRGLMGEAAPRGRFSVMYLLLWVGIGLPAKTSLGILKR